MCLFKIKVLFLTVILCKDDGLIFQSYGGTLKSSFYAMAYAYSVGDTSLTSSPFLSITSVLVILFNKQIIKYISP